jgi:hypothetical protein
MSYRCDVCHKVQAPGSKPEFVTTGKREVSYPARYSEDKRLIDKGGNGWEITGTKKVCKNCLKLEKKEIPVAHEDNARPTLQFSSHSTDR